MSEIFDELRAALWSVWHRRWIAIATAWGVCVLGWLVVSMIPNAYESKARVYVDVQDVLSKQLGIAGDGKEEIMRVRQTLSSAKNLEKVITSTRLGEGITERGALKVGNFADLAIFNPATISDVATFEKPQQYAVGMRHVFVNGVQVLKDGDHTGATPGRVVRGKGWKKCS